MGLCTAQCKMLLFCANTVVRESAKFELARLKKEEEEAILAVWRFSGAVLSRQIFTTLGVFLARKTLVVSCHKGIIICCPYFIFREILKDFFVLAYIACPLYPYIYVDSTESMIAVASLTDCFKATLTIDHSGHICDYTMNIVVTAP